MDIMDKAYVAVWAGYGQDGMDMRGHIHPHEDGEFYPDWNFSPPEEAEGVRRGFLCHAPVIAGKCSDPAPRVISAFSVCTDISEALDLLASRLHLEYVLISADLLRAECTDNDAILDKLDKHNQTIAKCFARHISDHQRFSDTALRLAKADRVDELVRAASVYTSCADGYFRSDLHKLALPDLYRMQAMLPVILREVVR